MYNVSQEYITALKKPYRTRRITGTVKNIPFDDSNISSGSFVFDHQCSEGSEVKIGTVYMSELTCTFRGINLNGQWKGATIVLSEGLLIGYDSEGDPIWEDVPLGIFTVDSANHTDQGVAVVAYDNMRKANKAFKFSTTNGTPYDYLLMIVTDCRMILAHTEEEIRALPNGTRAYTLYSENDIETYRDLLGWVAQTMGCFATINRDGELELRQYGTEPVDTISADDRYSGASFSDFETYYTGVSLTKVDDESTVYIGDEIDDGLTYNLGANPLLQRGVPDNSMRAILDSLHRIRYSPFTLKRSGCVMYDLGDVVQFTDNNGDGKVGCVMAFEYTYHSHYSMEGFGANPALIGAKSKTDKEISGLIHKESNNVFRYYTFTNAKEISISDDYKEIIYIRFGATKSTIVVFHAEIKLNAMNTEAGPHFDSDFLKVHGDVKYILNNAELDYKPQETWIEGNHILHLMYYIEIDDVSVNVLSVRMKTDGLINIERNDIQAVISGQGLVATNVWDGFIKAEDTIAERAFENEPCEVDAFDDETDVTINDNITITVSDDIDVADIANEPDNADTFSDAPYLNKVRLNTLTWQEVLDMGTWQNVLDEANW